MPDSVPRVTVFASASLWWRAAIVVAASLGLMSGEHRVAFFTTQSNIIVVAYFAIVVFHMLRSGQTDAAAPRLRGGVTLWIVITGLISHVLLSNLANPLPGLIVSDPAAALTNQSLFLLHYVVPVMVVIDWVAFGPRGVVRWRDGVCWLAYPVAYGVISIARAAWFPTVADRYPYPFLDPSQGGWAGVVAGLVPVIVISAVLAAGVIGLDRVSGGLSRRLAGRRVIDRSQPSPST